MERINNKKMPKITTEIKTVKLSEIKLNKDNPRTITEKDMAYLVKFLQEFPDMMKLREIVVDEDGMIIGGNMRFRGLQQIGKKTCIVKIVKGLTPEQKREFIIKDNSAFGTWDMDALSAEWDSLPLIEWGLDLPAQWMNPIPDENEPVDKTENECPKCGHKWIKNDTRTQKNTKQTQQASRKPRKKGSQ